MSNSRVTSQQVKHIAKLANLEISEEKIPIYQEQLSVIVEHFNDLKSLSFENVDETSRITKAKNVWREDEVCPSFTQEEALKNAQKTHQGYFVVPYLLTQKDQ